MRSGLGDRLRQAREAQKMSVDEVAALLRLKPAIVQALEEDQYQRLPSAAYARGYLRGYARLMRLDVEGFARNKQLEDDAALMQPFSGLATQRTVDAVWVVKITGYLMVGALGLWGVSWWQARWNDATDKTISLESLSTDGSPTLEIDLRQIDLRQLRAEKTAADGKTKGSKTHVEHNGPPLEQVATPVPPQNTKPQNINRHRRRIDIQLTKPAWIEITDAERSLFYGLARPGEAISVSGQQPFKLVLGNASEVSLHYDGKRIEVSQFMDKGIARFTLDDKRAYR